MPLIGRIASAAARGYGLFANMVQAAVDPYFNYVVALLHGDGTNGGQNNTFLDSSTNNFTITRNGNTTQGSFSPFSQTGWGNYFDGNGDYLTVANNAALQFGTGDFTVECWAYVNNALSTQTTLFSIGRYDNGLLLRIFGGSSDELYINGSFYAVPFSTYMQPYAWAHIAVTRSGSALKVFVNGSVALSTTNTANIAQSTNTTIGAATHDTTQDMNGYISNFRLVKGTAVYTSNFTPPTTPLTAITNTQLLTCQSNRFIDNSTNAFAITKVGDTSVQPFSPFNPTTAYSASSIGGSGYFDGSGDYLTAPNNAALDLGAGDFTLEIIWYPTAIPGSYYLLDKSSTNGWNLGGNASSFSFWANGANRLIFSRNPIIGQWNHIVVERVGSTIYGWINGASAGTTTYSAAISESTIFSLSANSYPINGYATCTRLVKGSAVYSGAAPSFPTTPLTAVTNTQLLLNFTNGAIFDNAAVADYETVGNAQISTSVKKYGTGSLALDGTGDYLVTDAPSTDLFAFGTGDFTIEFWLYLNSTSGTPMIYDGRPSLTNGAQPTIYMNGAVITYFTNAGNRITGSSLSASTWYHVALCRVASQTRMFVNGTQVGATYADTTAYTNTAGRPVYGVDGNSGNTNYFNGYIDDLRVTKGIGRYAYSFTPPTAEFPNIGGTVTLTADPYYEYTTLLLPGNGTNGAQNNTFLDSSTNAFTITRNGNTTQGTFSPFSQTGWSNYFDGTGDYLETPSNAAFTLGSSGDFTIECWVYLTATSGNYAAFLTTWADALSNYTNRWWVGTNADGILRWYDSSGNTGIVDSVVLTLNTWFHVAVVRSGSTITLYKNGTAIGTQTTNQAYTTQGSVKMGYSGTNSGYYFGYISNARVVKGTAVYTANFTPPTTPLTAITNTSLLTCQSNRFVDNSSNAFAITRNGDVSVQAFSPFNPTASWSAATYGGSGYFDGSGDYLQSSITALSGQFTVEFWVYRPSAGNNFLFTIGDSSASSGAEIYIGSSGAQLNYYSSNAVRINGGTPPAAGQWNYFAVTRDASNDVRLYANGVQVGSSYNQSGTLSTDLRVGAEYYGGAITGTLNGYMGAFRISNTVRTVTTVPTSLWQSDANTVFLANFTNAGIYDATSKNDLETVGNAQISTTQSKFGGSSMYFDGTGDGLKQPAVQNLNWSFGSGDMTIECWAYFNSVSGYQTLVDFRPSGGGFGTSSFVLWVDAGTLSFFAGAYSGASPVLSGGSISTGQWYHIVISRYGGTTKLFLNGNQTATTTNAWAQTFSATDILSIGATTNVTGNYLNGYIQDLRITKGIARYTSNFTPPTTAFLTL